MICRSPISHIGIRRVQAEYISQSAIDGFLGHTLNDYRRFLVPKVDITVLRYRRSVDQWGFNLKKLTNRRYCGIMAHLGGGTKYKGNGRQNKGRASPFSLLHVAPMNSNR